MIAHGSLWIAFTVLAAAGQTLRNVMQRGLIATLGTVGATHIRFIFGLPFAVLFLLLVRFGTGTPIPLPGAVPLLWTAFGAAAQFIATALMLATMRERSFVVTTAFIKIEPVQTAVFALIFLGEAVRPLTLLAIVVATAGVMFASWPRKDLAGTAANSWRTAVPGIAAGGCFALSSVGYRGGITSLGEPSFVMAASTILVASLTIHTVVLASFLVLKDRPTMLAILRLWRPSLLAGFLGALASQFWFLAFALADAASVRTLGLVEMLFAGIVSRRLLKQGSPLLELIGMVLIVGGVAILVSR